ncbi:MAG: maleylpyruvate isomerase N-terminal domain-containing protein [Actinomycetota bacterium]|nr:maleylpyruvate isomerase N-terminal domain-containing protein [Actinomycetota bacterium]
MVAIGQVDPAAAQAAVASSSARLTSLLRSATRPSAPALGEWDLTDVAVHLSHAVDGVTAMAKGGGPLLEDIGQLPLLTGALVRGEAERSLAAVADRMDASVVDFLGVVRAGRAEERRVWLVDGVELTLTNLTCHVLNELIVHGHDIAVANGVPWPIERSHAALVLCGFLFPAMDGLGRALVDQDEAGELRAGLDVRLRGGGRAFLRFDHGDLSVEPSPPGPADCHLSVDPATFLLVAWGRKSQWPAILRGQLLAWGRRPWLGARLRALLQNP